MEVNSEDQIDISTATKQMQQNALNKQKLFLYKFSHKRVCSYSYASVAKLRTTNKP